MIVIYGQRRILFAMAADGMIPELFHTLNPRTYVSHGVRHWHLGRHEHVGLTADVEEN